MTRSRLALPAAHTLPQAIVACALLAASACRTAPTQVTVLLDTDAPTNRALEVTVRALRASTTDGSSAPMRVLSRGGPAGRDVFPGSLAITPGEGRPRDEIVTVVVEGRLAAAAPGDVPLTMRRVARFAFIPGRTTFVRVFLPVACGALATGCTTVGPAACTVSVRCEMMATCGDEGRCVPIAVTPVPELPPARPDAAPMDAVSDAVTDAPRDAMTDAAPDAPACGQDLARCGASCVDLATDPRHCGACDRACDLPNASSRCVAGACVLETCASGFADCNAHASDGCEAPTGARCVGADGCLEGRVACATGGSIECVGLMPARAGTTCGPDRVCDGAGACRGTVITAGVGCSSPMGRTADELCRSAGFAGATFARGFGWFQCGGTLERCPGGWQGDGTQCPDWCSGTDCVEVPFCGAGPMVRESSGDGRTLFVPTELTTCDGYNPGWTVRLRCQY